MVKGAKKHLKTCLGARSVTAKLIDEIGRQFNEDWSGHERTRDFLTIGGASAHWSQDQSARHPLYFRVKTALDLSCFATGLARCPINEVRHSQKILPKRVGQLKNIWAPTLSDIVDLLKFWFWCRRWTGSANWGIRGTWTGTTSVGVWAPSFAKDGVFCASVQGIQPVRQGNRQGPFDRTVLFHEFKYWSSERARNIF